ncbi:MAG: pyrimidine 5'-nucleotidase [Rhodospirillales bacterium]|nr:pyrimidine 5'-nucleotidase [Rhodospirillales bacterium]
MFHAFSTPARTLGGAPLKSAETWIFDLDNTLYPKSSNLFRAVEVRIRDFVSNLLVIGPEEAFQIQKKYLKEYGTTLGGLMACHGVDPTEYLDHVHNIDLSPIGANPDLERALGRLEGRKHIFTNADAAHAERIMERIGIRHHFETVFDIEATDYVPKPDPGVYKLLVNRLDLDPAGCVMVEDMARNLEPAARLGMTTVWLRNDSPWGLEGSDGDHIHHIADDLVDWLNGIAATGPARG